MKEELTNPYVGLRPYQDNESLLFFGRNEQNLELLQRLHQHHFVAVVGSSGCGKSSLLRAGLIPSLKAGYLVDNCDNWFISIMKPGQDPMRNLCRSLLEELFQSTDQDSIDQLVQTVEEEGVDAILGLLEPLWKSKRTNFFILIDQFEELFRYASEDGRTIGRDGAIDFVNIFLELAEQKELPIYIVLTMRSDFIGDCSEFRGLPEAMNKSLYLVPRLSRQQLKMVIEGPARLFSTQVNPSLTSKLLNAMGKVKDELPLLQHALMRIWEYEKSKGQDGEMNLDDYRAVGGLEMALSMHADEALKTLSKEEFQIAKKMFQALTTIDDHGRKTRRPVHYGTLLELTEANEKQLDKVINAFIRDQRSFLMVEETGKKRENNIDISHESLIRQWKRLERWVTDEGEAAAEYMRLAQYCQWNNEGTKELLSGIELELSQKWFEHFKPTKIWANRYHDNFEESVEYLHKSVAADQSAKRKALKRRRSNRAILGSLIGVVLLCAVFASMYFYNLAKEADERTREIVEKAKEMMANAHTDEDQNTGQDSTLYVEGYKDVIRYIESQQALYEGHKGTNELGEIVFDPQTDELEDDAYDLWKLAKDSIKSREKRLAAAAWEATNTAESSEVTEALRNYLNTIESLEFADEITLYREDAEERLRRLDSIDPKWIGATTKNTVKAYAEYLNELSGKTQNIENIPEDMRRYVDSAFNRIRALRSGWLFAGRLDGGKSEKLSPEDRIFKVVYRTTGGSPSSVNSIPKKGDLLQVTDRRGRSVYNDFTGSAVVNKKSVPIHTGDYALALEVETLLGGAVFVKISY